MRYTLRYLVVFVAVSAALSAHTAVAAHPSRVDERRGAERHAPAPGWLSVGDDLFSVQVRAGSRPPVVGVALLPRPHSVPRSHPCAEPVLRARASTWLQVNTATGAYGIVLDGQTFMNASAAAYAYRNNSVMLTVGGGTIKLDHWSRYVRVKARA